MNLVVADTTETTVAATGEEPKRRSPHGLNQKQIQSIDLADKVARAAQKPLYTAALSLRTIQPESIAELAEEIRLCRKALTTTLAADTNAITQTVRERETKAELCAALQSLQAAARQKHARTQPEQLKAYYVGINLRRLNRASLVQVALSVLEQAKSDTLPGITPEVRLALQQKCTAYVEADGQQQSELAASKDHRVATLRHLKRLTDLRLEIQFAVDGLYPYTSPESASVRAEFGLPPRRPFIAS